MLSNSQKLYWNYNNKTCLQWVVHKSNDKIENSKIIHFLIHEKLMKKLSWWISCVANNLFNPLEMSDNIDNILVSLKVPSKHWPEVELCFIVLTTIPIKTALMSDWSKYCTKPEPESPWFKLQDANFYHHKLFLYYRTSSRLSRLP